MGKIQQNKKIDDKLLPEQMFSKMREGMESSM
jgi:hypothetical protein